MAQNDISSCWNLQNVSYSGVSSKAAWQLRAELMSFFQFVFFFSFLLFSIFPSVKHHSMSEFAFYGDTIIKRRHVACGY